MVAHPAPKGKNQKIVKNVKSVMSDCFGAITKDKCFLPFQEILLQSNVLGQMLSTL